MQIAFLLGAGASYGAGGIVPVPPLGNQLYARLVEGFPNSWGTVSADLFTEDFEVGMHQLWTQELLGAGEVLPESPSVEELLHDMTLYFCRFSLRSDVSLSCYSDLLAFLARRRLLPRSGFATLNYECVFEHAAADLGLRLGYCRAGSPQDLVLWKPHGSCNWFPNLPSGITWKNCRMGGSLHYFDGGIRVAGPEELRSLEERYASGSFPFPAAMSLFAPGKHNPVAPEAIDQIRREWCSWISLADIIIVIGARYVPEDRHVWEPILESGAHVWFVGNTDDAKFTALYEVLGGRLEGLATTFEDALGPLQRRLSLLP